jgi:mycothiol S-conjugate amidase
VVLPRPWPVSGASSSGLRLLAVHAHPDDESSKGAAATARYAAEGLSVLVVTCTRGERGSVLNPEVDPATIGADLAGVRRTELEQARRILGVSQLSLGFVDSGMPYGGPPPAGSFAAMSVATAARPLIAAVRRFRPHVMVTYDPAGGYPHPDHVMSHRVGVEAFRGAGRRDVEIPGTRPWQTLKLYYHVPMHPLRRLALRREMRRRGLTCRFDEADEVRCCPPPAAMPLTARIRCAEHFTVRDRALRAHRSQICKDSPWFMYPADVEREVWPTEDFFLARSLVPTSRYEDDLFAGLRAG